jgi:Flp pilus assembly protein TadG
MKLRLSRGPKALLADRSGGVAVLFAFAAVPLLVTLAAVVDYARAAKVRGQMAAIADAAVLAATTPDMLTRSTAAAKQAATDMFTAQASIVSGMTFEPAKLTVTVNDIVASSSIQRSVDVSYDGKTNNAFGKLISQTTTNFKVNSSVSATNSPDIDFYMLLDNSPSMLLPATAAGVQFMITNTGCAYACHENTTDDWEYTVHYPGWGKKSGPGDTNTYIDSYTYAKNSGIALRIDNVKDAVNRVATTSMNTMTANGASYRMGVFAFNYGFTTLKGLTKTNNGNQTSIKNAVSTLLPPLMDSNTNLAGNQKFTYPTSANTWNEVNLNSSPQFNNDAMTDFTMAMTKMNAAMTTPGNGTQQVGDKPQAVLMIVTDGVVDSSLYSSTSCNGPSPLAYSTTIGGTSYAFTRCQAPIDTAMCNTIKARNIRIAVLYTTYQPLNGQGWYDAYIKPIINQVEPALRSCASSNDLFAEVTTGGDIQTALDTLFKKAVSSAPRLTN